MSKKEHVTSEKYVLALGAVPIDISKQLETIGDRTDSKEIVCRVVEECYQRMLAVIRESPSVERIEAPEKLRGFDIVSFGFENKHRVLMLHEPIKIECILPERLQMVSLGMWSDFPPDAIDSSPRFNLLYDGTCFAFYRPIRNPRGILCGAADARKLLEDILSEFNVAHAAPTPLREDFIVDLHPVKGATDLTVSVVDDYQVEVATRIGIKDPDIFMQFLFSRVSFQLMDFYSLSNCSTELNLIRWEIEDICRNILTERFKAMFLSPYSFQKRRLTAKKLEHLIHTFYELYSKWSRIQNEVKAKIPGFERNLEEPLDTISQKLLLELEVGDLPISAYGNIVELGQRDVTSYRSLMNLWITVGMSLVSAMLGAVVVALLTT